MEYNVYMIKLVLLHVHPRHRHPHSAGHWVRHTGRSEVRPWIPDQFPHLVCLEFAQVHQLTAVHEALEERVDGDLFV